MILGSLARKIQLLGQTCMAKRELQLLALAPSESIWTWIFTSYNILLAFWGQRLDKLPKAAQRRYSVNICRTKMHKLASLLPAFIYSSLLPSACIYWAPTMPGIVRNIKREKTWSPSSRAFTVQIRLIPLLVPTVGTGGWMFFGSP